MGIGIAVALLARRPARWASRTGESEALAWPTPSPGGHAASCRVEDAGLCHGAAGTRAPAQPSVPDDGEGDRALGARAPGSAAARIQGTRPRDRRLPRLDSARRTTERLIWYEDRCGFLTGCGRHGPGPARRHQRRGAGLGPRAARPPPARERACSRDRRMEKPAPGAWRPLVEGETAARALAAAADIARDLAADSSQISGPGVNRGLAGLRSSSPTTSGRSAMPGPASAPGSISNGRSPRAGGAAGAILQPVSRLHGRGLGDRAPGGGRKAEEDVNEEIDAALLSILRRAPWRGEFDLLEGSRARELTPWKDCHAPRR